MHWSFVNCHLLWKAVKTTLQLRTYLKWYWEGTHSTQGSNCHLEVIYYPLIFVIYWPPQFSWLRQLLRAFPVRFQGSPVRWPFPAQQNLPWLFQRLPPRRGPSWTCPFSSGETWTILASSPASQQVWSIIQFTRIGLGPLKKGFWAYTVPPTDHKPHLLCCFLNFRNSEKCTAIPPGV